MERGKLIGSIVFVVTSLLLNSCAFPTAAGGFSTPTVNPTVLAKAISGTLQARAAAQTAQASSGTLITDEMSQPSSSSDLPALVPVTGTTCNEASFIEDVSIPDGSNVAAGAAFTKTWRLMNVGSCTWTPSYQVVFDHGDRMSGPAAFSLPATVEPGQTVDIPISLTAPSNSGSYSGSWMLQDPSGTLFGVGANGGVPFYVSIQVGSPSSSFAVIHVDTRVNDFSVKTACPPGHTFIFTANIGTNARGIVTYHWEFSDGTVTGDKALAFADSDTLSVTSIWKLGQNGPAVNNPYHGWARIYVNQPNHQIFEKVNITLDCT